ncbi:hypothetical protein [Bradyrhizobium diazoefficiens]
MEDLEDFIHLENLKILRRQIDLAKDDVRRQWLMIRLAEEEAKGRGCDPIGGRRRTAKGPSMGDVW